MANRQINEAQGGSGENLLHNLGRTCCSRELDKSEGANASRMTPGAHVAAHDRTASVLCMTEKGVMRGKIWNRQATTDASKSQVGQKLCGIPWQLFDPELRLR